MLNELTYESRLLMGSGNSARAGSGSGNWALFRFLEPGKREAEISWREANCWIMGRRAVNRSSGLESPEGRESSEDEG